MNTLARLNDALSDRYRIERELGVGGMATVYLAHDLKHDRDVAMKVLHPDLGVALGAERFLSEIKTTAKLQHPHILPLLDSGEADGLLYYVMPVVAGETLRARLERERQLPIAEAVRIAREVASALDYAHRHGVIHRDIKPENILLHDGAALVADFGIALAVQSAGGQRMTQTGLSLGTPQYMSPEQAMGEKTIDARSDIYALGAVTYEMLTGDAPFTGSSVQAIVAKVLNAEAERPSLVRKTIPLNVEQAVLTALAKLPADRFATAAEFAAAIANPQYATASAVETGASSTRSRGRVPMRAFVATAAVALLAVMTAAYAWLRVPPSEKVSRFSIVLPDSQALSSNTGTYRIAVSRDGRQIAYVGVGTIGATTRLWLRRLDQLSATPIPGTEDASNPSFSPDGQYLAFVSGSPRALKKIALAGGPPIVVTDSLVDLGGVSWGSDGYIYFDGHLTGDGLARVRETGGKPEIASMPDTGETWHSGPEALPNGRGVLMSIARARGTAGFDVGVVDTRTGKHRVLVRGGFGPRYALSGHLLYVTFDGTLMAAPFDENRLALTGEPVPIATGLAARGLARTDVVVSANGLLVYAAGPTTGRTRELVWVARDGTATEVDSAWTLPFVGRAAISPDGKSAAVAAGPGMGRSQLWVKQLDRGPANKLSDAGQTPTWSPDGKTILFVSDLQLARVPADGSALPVAIYAGPRESRKAQPQYSPDGKWIVFSDGGKNIRGRATDADSVVRDLVSGAATASRTALSPDGRWLAYDSDETGRMEIHVRPFPNTTAANHQVSLAGGTNVRWSRDGRELFYVDEHLDLIAVPITLSPTFAAGTPHRLFSAVPYLATIYPFDVGPDGRFLMTRPVGGGANRPDELVLVQNVFEELKAKVRAKR